MASTRTIPEAIYTPGTYGPIELNQLPGSSEGFKVWLSYPPTFWPSGPCVRIITEWSQNNGATWELMMDVTANGGPQTKRDGTPATGCGFSQTWPGEAGPNGRVMLRGSDVRITAIVLQTITTAVTIEAL